MPKQLCMGNCGNLATEGCWIVRGRKKYLLCRLHFNMMTGRDPRYPNISLQRERGIKLPPEGVAHCKHCSCIPGENEWANEDYCAHCWDHTLSEGWKRRYITLRSSNTSAKQR